MLWFAVFIAAVVGLLLPLGLSPLLHHLGVIDVPNERSSHDVPVIRGAGIAPLCALIAGLGVVLISSHRWGQDEQVLTVVLVASVLAGALGWWEDFQGVRVAARAGIQLVIGAAATLALTVLFDAPWGLMFVGAFVVAAYINVANFMDGIDAISGVHGTIFGGVFVALGGYSGVPWLVIAGAVLAVCFATFLPWNVLRGRMFLGDVGSYLLGGAVAVMSVGAVLAGLPLLAVVAPMVIYLADTGYTLAVRVARGERWHEAHRSHVYQRFSGLGWSHVKSAGVVASFSLAASAAGFLSFVPGGWGVLSAALAEVALAATYLALLRMFGIEPAAPRQKIGPSEEHEADADPTDEPKPLQNKPLIEGGAPVWAVVGASGFIGSALSARLAEHGVSVIPVPAPRLLLPPEDASAPVVDQDVVEGLAEQLAEASVVVNAAGLAAPDSAADAALFGANTLLPVAIATAAAQAGCSRFVHLSSAAVQGRRAVLDETAETAPFSPYSTSKAAGESALLNSFRSDSADFSDVVIVRATSVQGAGRRTTEQLQRLARSPLSSVAKPGDQPTVVSSVHGLTEFIWMVGSFPGLLPPIVLQPWEGMTTRQVLLNAGGREPLQLPVWFCRAALTAGYFVGKFAGGLNGMVRRVELMWFGQEQDSDWYLSTRHTLSPSEDPQAGNRFRSGETRQRSQSERENLSKVTQLQNDHEARRMVRPLYQDILESEGKDE